MGTPGPTSDLTENIINQICGVLNNYGSEKIACHMIQLPKGTYDTWKMKGKRALDKFKEGREITENEKMYMKLVMQVRQAKAQAEWDLSKNVAESAEDQGDVRSAQWLLKHLYNWSSKQKVEVSDKRSSKSEDAVKEMLNDPEAQEHARNLAEKMMEKEGESA